MNWRGRFARFVVSLVVLLFFCGLLNLGCKSTLSSLGFGYRAVSIVSVARNQTAAGIKAVCQPRLVDCQQKHPTDKDAFKECLGRCPKAVNIWHTKVYPAVQAAISATMGGLEAARARKEKDWNWLKVVLPAVCGLAKALKDLKPLLGKKADTILKGIDLGRKWVCP